MNINDKINQMSTEEKAKLFSSWTTTGACNDFGILPNRKCDGKIDFIKTTIETEGYKIADTANKMALEMNRSAPNSTVQRLD